MASNKSLLSNWVPPVIINAGRNFLGKGNRYIGNFSSWEAAAALCNGYDTDLILKKVLNATLKVKNGEAAFERDSVLFDNIQYSWPVTSALMLAAAKNGGELNVLDFGGALGSCYFQNKKFLNQLNKITWSVVEQPHFVKAGKMYIENGELKFYYTIEESIDNISPNLILLSSVVQYLPNLDSFLDRINTINAEFLVFDRTPFTDQLTNMICVQKVPSKIYDASYPMWLISRKALADRLSYWHPFEVFEGPVAPVTLRKGMCFDIAGCIFIRKSIFKI